MINWLSRPKKKQAVVDHEAELTAKLAEKLKSYNADEDTSISDFSEIDFTENDDKTEDKKGGVKKVDVWGRANPGETGKWIKEDGRLKDRRQDDRRQNNRRNANRRRDDR